MRSVYQRYQQFSIHFILGIVIFYSLYFENYALHAQNMNKLAIREEITAAMPAITLKRPSIAIMVENAIKNLNERDGASFYAIKRYINNTCELDALKITPETMEYERTATNSGVLIRTPNSCAHGLFMLPNVVAEKNAKFVAVEKSFESKEAKK